MSPKELTALRIDPELMAGLRAIKDRDGIPVSEQIRRALQAWLEQKGLQVSPVRRGAKVSKAAMGVAKRIKRSK